MTESHTIIGEVVSLSKELENLLRTQFNAQGKGLHELISSIQPYLENNNVNIKKLRKIASIRNSVVHESNKDTNITYFKRITDESINELKNILKLKNYQETIYIKDDEIKYPKIESNQKNENKIIYLTVIIVLILSFLIYNLLFSTNYAKVEERLKTINTEISYLENKINETNILINQEKLKHNFFSKTFNKSEKLKELENISETNKNKLKVYIEEREKLKNILLKK